MLVAGNIKARVQNIFKRSQLSLQINTLNARLFLIAAYIHQKDEVEWRSVIEELKAINK